MNKKQSCALCGKTIFLEQFSIDGKTIEKCTTCSLVRTKNFEEPNYDEYHRDDSYDKGEKFLKFFFKKRFNILKPYIKNTGSVLEIGSSTGVFLDIYKSHQWKTFGIEPSQSGDIAKKKHHTIYKSRFEATNLPEHAFDLIIANHVLEHITEPLPFLKKIKKNLKADGVLYIDVPNVGSLFSSIRGKSWPYYLPREHATHFTPLTLSHLLEKSGFEVLFITTKSGIFEVSNPIKYLLLELFSFKKNFFRDIAFIPLDLVSRILNKGDSISIIAKHSNE